MRTQLGPQPFGEVDVERLHRGIHGQQRRPGQAGERSDQHDAAPAALAHGRREVSGQRDRTDARQLDLLQRVLERVVEKLRRPVRGAGVVDQQSDLEPVGRLGHAFRDVRDGQVQHQRPYLDAMALAHVGRKLVQLRSLARDQHEIQSALGQLVGQAGADSLGRAGDDGPPSVLLREIVCHAC